MWKDVLGEVWEVCLGCGERCEKCVGVGGRCGKSGKVWGSVENVCLGEWALGRCGKVCLDVGGGEKCG